MTGELLLRDTLERIRRDLDRWPSGQWQQAVNLPLLASYGGSNPPLSTTWKSQNRNWKLEYRSEIEADVVLSFNFRISSFVAGGGSNSVVESQPSKLLVAGSIPVSRSISKFENGNSKLGNRRMSHEFLFSNFEFRASVARRADVAQSVEHVLGKDGVSGSIPLIGSRNFAAGPIRHESDFEEGAKGSGLASKPTEGLITHAAPEI